MDSDAAGSDSEHPERSSSGGSWHFSRELSVLVVFAFISLLFLSVQSCQTREALELSRSAQRPFVLALPTDLDEDGLLVGEPVVWRVEYGNYGQSPAVRLTGRGRVFVGEDAMAEVDEMFEDLPSATPTLAFGLLPPTRAGEEGGGRTDLSSRETLTAEDLSYIRAHGGVIQAGRLDYEDIVGDRYWTNFCHITLADRTTSACDRHHGAN